MGSNQPLADALTLLRTNPPADFLRCAETLFDVLKKAAVKDADGSYRVGEQKHRHLNRSAPVFVANVATVKGGVRFLRAAGFVDNAEQTHLVIADGSDPATIVRARNLLKGVVASVSAEATHAAEVQRAADNANAAERLVDLKRVQKTNSGPRTALEEAERMRILREIQAGKFERERQLDPTNHC